MLMPTPLLQQQNFIPKAKQIKLMILDVDGVLTDGRIYVDDQGIEIKAFHVLDGIGIKFLQQTGIKAAVISGRFAPGVNHRLEALDIKHIFLGVENKKAVYNSLLEKLNLSAEQTAYIGDDLPDLSLLRTAGLGIAVSNAVPEVLSEALFVTQNRGGEGAVVIGAGVSSAGVRDLSR